MRSIAVLLPLVFSFPVVGEDHISADEFSGVLGRSGNVYIAGQPTETGIRSMKAGNVSTVINLRTPPEMAALDFDERELVDQLGMEYVFLPSGGAEHPYSADTLSAFAEALDNAEGDVLLHCRSATRASHLWVAYLVKYRGIPMNEALAEGKSINFGTTPIEGYLGSDFEYSYTGSDAAKDD